MFKRWFLLLLLVLITAMPAAAQSADWFAWLYSATNGQIQRIDKGGLTAETVQLPLSQAFNTYGQSVAVSPTGRYIAYTMFDSTATTPYVQLAVFDRNLSAIRFTHDLGEIDAFYTAPLAFDDARGRFAFGYQNAQGAQVVVGDFLTSSAIASLSDHEALYAGNAPRVYTYKDGDVHLNIDGVGYAWDTESGDVSAAASYTGALLDVDPATGQVVAAHNDDSRSQAISAEEAIVYNAVTVTNATGDQTLLYHVDNGTVRGVRFIESGARVLITLYRFAEDQTVLIVLNRDGTVAGEIVGALETLSATPDGFIGMFTSGNSPAIAYINTTAPTLTPATLWSGSAGSVAALVAVTN